MEKNVTVKIDRFAVRLTRPRIETKVVKCGSSRCDFLTYPDSYFPKFSPPLDLCMARSWKMLCDMIWTKEAVRDGYACTVASMVSSGPNERAKLQLWIYHHLNVDD